MLKEYTLKVTVRVGGEGEGDCDDKLHLAMEVFEETQWEIIREEVVVLDPETPHNPSCEVE